MVLGWCTRFKVVTVRIAWGACNNGIRISVLRQGPTNHQERDGLRGGSPSRACQSLHDADVCCSGAGSAHLVNGIPYCRRGWDRASSAWGGVRGAGGKDEVKRWRFPLWAGTSHITPACHMNKLKYSTHFFVGSGARPAGERPPSLVAKRAQTSARHGRVYLERCHQPVGGKQG